MRSGALAILCCVHLAGAGASTWRPAPRARVQDRAHGEETFARAEKAFATAGTVTPEAKALYHEALRDLLRVDPADQGNSRKVGVAFARVGDHARSLAIWREIRAKHPDDAQAVELEIGSLAASGAVAEAVAAYADAVDIAPGAARRALLAFPADSPELKTARWPRGDPAPRILAARDLLARGSSQEALGVLLDLARDANVLRSVEGLLLQCSGRSIEEGRYEEGLGGFRRICEASPADYLAKANLGVALRIAGRVEAAKAAYAEAIGLAPHDGALRNDLGIVLQGDGDRAGAERMFREAMSVEPDGSGGQNGATNLAWLRRDDAQVREELLPKLARVAADPTRLRARILFLRVATARGRDEIL